VLTRLLVAAPEDSENGLGVRRRPDFAARWFGRIPGFSAGVRLPAVSPTLLPWSSTKGLPRACRGGHGARSRTNAVSVSYR
jgi:hypothetical protein